jgi:hypothetical protein
VRYTLGAQTTCISYFVAKSGLTDDFLKIPGIFPITPVGTGNVGRGSKSSFRNRC